MSDKQRKFKIGDRIWTFDENRRVYSSGGHGPIYSEHFVPWTVVGSKGRSYLCQNQHGRTEKVGFTVAETRWFSDSEREDKIWKRQHERSLVHFIERMTGPELRKLAGLIGWEPK